MTALPTAVIFDIDGTLCDVRTAKHHLHQTPRDFDSFFTASLSCPPHPAVLAMVTKARAAGHVPLVVTARSDAYQGITEQWLDSTGVNHDGLFMRPGDPLCLIPDDDVKEAILADILRSYTPVHAFEDNPSVVALWKRHGIPVTVVPGFDGSLGDGGTVEIDNPFAR